MVWIIRRRVRKEAASLNSALISLNQNAIALVRLIPINSIRIELVGGHLGSTIWGEASALETAKITVLIRSHRAHLPP